MMDSSYTENVLAEIEEEFQDIVKDSNNGADLLDEAIEEYDVVDSWEIGRVDDIHDSDIPYHKSERRSKGSSYIRRREDEYSRRSRPFSYRRPCNRSYTKPNDYHLSARRSRERRSVDRSSVEYLHVSVKNSPRRNDKLPDLKCTTSVETGEINVVVLPGDRSTYSFQDGKGKPLSDPGRRKTPTLLKNPFAYGSFKGKNSDSPERVRIGEIEASPRHSLERQRLESRDYRSHDSRNKGRSSSPTRSKSSRRSSPYFHDRRNRKQSASRSPERYPKKKRSQEYRRSHESSRWRNQSREGSILSRVSSKSSLSFISLRGQSPQEHDRKQSPLRPCKFYNEPRQSNECYFSSSEDFNHKLTILLKEGKQKQLSSANDSEPCQPLSYPNPAWKADNWGSSGGSVYPLPQDPNANYSSDSVVKPNYDLHQTDYSGYPQGQYNQAYYHNNQLQNYPNTYPGKAENALQLPYNYGHQYPSQIPNQYYPQTTPGAMNFPTMPYAGQPNVGHYHLMGQPLQLPGTENMVQPPLNVPQHSYNMTNEQHNYMEMNSFHGTNVQSSVPPETPQNNSLSAGTDWSKRDYERIPTRTSIPLTPKENKSNEEDPMRTPPPPVISDTWREIESAEKSLWKGSNKTWEVLSKCQRLLQKLMSNDPSMERFKVAQFDNLIQFSVKEETKCTPSSISRNAVRAARRLAKTMRYQSPLLRKRNNPQLKFGPWIPED